MSVLDDVRVSPAMQRMAADVAKGEPFYQYMDDLVGEYLD